jgi:ankyrin repeat protein
VAAKKGFIDIVKYLIHQPLNQRIPIDSQKNNGMTPAMLAVQKNHLFILRMLREAGSNLKKTLDTQGGINLVYIAAQNGHDVIVSYLIDKSIIKDGNLYFDKNE